MRKLLEARGEAGAAPLALVLVLMLIGALILPALLHFVSTGLKAGKLIEERTLEYYAADAGIEDALWRIKKNLLPEPIKGRWGEETYEQRYDYELPATVNDREVEVTIKPEWVLAGLETDKYGVEPHAGLVTTEYVVDYVDTATPPYGVYQIRIFYDQSIGELKIDKIGCWLPPGFDYVLGSSNLEQDPSKPYYSVPTTFDHNGGKAITWEFRRLVDYDELPFLDEGAKRGVEFKFTPADFPRGSFSWVRTNRRDIYLSWDTSSRLYEVVSTATSASGKTTTVTAYLSKKEFSGDYQATGNTLMRDHDKDKDGKRERLYKETSAEIKDIPPDATVEAIFLYWTGWKNEPWDAWKLSSEKLQALPADLKVDKVAFKVEIGGVTYDTEKEPGKKPVAASVSQVLAMGTKANPQGWSYSCFANVTALLTEFFKKAGVNFVGNGKYTVGHPEDKVAKVTDTRLYEWRDNHLDEPVIGYTRYPLGSVADDWAYGGWSVIVIYSSPTTKGHDIHLYDDFRHFSSNPTLPFTIKGLDIPNDPEAPSARLTCFVGDGDEADTGDSISVNGFPLSALPTNPQDNVWNNKANLLGGVVIDGIDIDTYTVSGESGIIKPGDSEAEIKLSTGKDSWNLVYMIASFRREGAAETILSYNVKLGN